MVGALFTQPSQNGTADSQPNAGSPTGVMCGGPGIVRFPWPDQHCPSIDTPFGHLASHVLSAAELAAPDQKLGGSAGYGNLSGTGAAVSPALQGPSGSWFGTIIDGLNTILHSLTSANFWKGAGLVLAAAVAVGVGVILWAGKGPEVQRAVEGAAGGE